MTERTGLSKVSGKAITIVGNNETVRAINDLSHVGLITFSRMIKFKSTEYAVHFFKPTESTRRMYGLKNEVLVVCCTDAMSDFKSRTKDFIDYMLETKTEFKNRLDKGGST